jgi:replicative DNA helicase
MTITRTNGNMQTNAGVPPHNLDAEKSVLGAILLTDRTLHTIVLETGLTEHDFYRERHGLAFAAMRALHTAGEPIDQLTVVDKLTQHGTLENAGGPEYIDELTGWVPAAGHGVAYANIVHDLALTRSLLTATYEIQAQIAERRSGGEELIEEAERLIFALRATKLGAKQRLLEDAIADEIDRLERAARDDREIPGLATGLPELDKLLGGLQDGRLYVIAARPAMGKSLLTLQIARHAAMLEQQRVLFASLEMSDSETAPTPPSRRIRRRPRATPSGQNPARRLGTAARSRGTGLRCGPSPPR